MSGPAVPQSTISLIAVAALALDKLWEGSSSYTYIKEDWTSYLTDILRKSQCSRETLQTAPYYLHLCTFQIQVKVEAAQKAHSRLCNPVLIYDLDLVNLHNIIEDDQHPFASAKKTFLAAIICASRVLQDGRYTVEEWAALSSIPVQDLRDAQQTLQNALGGLLEVPKDVFVAWTRRLQGFAEEYENRMPAARTQSGPVPVILVTQIA